MVEQDGDDLHGHSAQLASLCAVSHHGHEAIEETGQHACHLQIQESRLHSSTRMLLPRSTTPPSSSLTTQQKAGKSMIRRR